MLVPKDVIMFWPENNSNIPSNWVRETSLDDKFIKGWGDKLPSETGGSNSHYHVGVSHSHSMNAHSHVISNTSYFDPGWEDGGGENIDPYAQKNHYHLGKTISTIVGGTASGVINFGSVSNNNHPPYRKLIFIKAGTGGAFIAEGIIALWNQSTVPNNWDECTDGSNGAPALGNKFVRGPSASQDSDVVSNYGTQYHTHDVSHTHDTTHYHTGQTGGFGNTTLARTSGDAGQLHGSFHYVTLNSQSLTTDAQTLTYTSDDLI